MSRLSWATVEFRRLLLAISLSILASACAQLPKPELAAYTAAFDATRSAAEPMVADLAAAERDRLVAEMTRNRSYVGFFTDFRPSDATSLSSLSLPPGAALIDRSFQAISTYNQTLVALAENRNIEEARSQLGQTVDDLGGIAQGVGVTLPGLKDAAQLFVTALAPAIEADNKEQFKRLVLAGEPKVQALIEVLREATPTQYSRMTSALQRTALQDPPAPDKQEAVDKINDWQRAFADYVVLLDALKVSLSNLHSAVERPKSVPLLQRLAAGSSDLRAYADALRLSIAQVRAHR